MRAILITLLLAVFSLAVEAARDYPGASDHAQLERFPLSHIVYHRSAEEPEYRLALGELKKINNVVVPEKEMRLRGELKRVVYQIPEHYDSDEPFFHFRRQLLSQGAELLFECQGRDCGSSTYWANNIFRYSTLYGLEMTQRYLAARLGGSYIALYSVKRGNKRIYTNVDLLQVEQEDAVSLLQRQGFLRLADPQAALSQALLAHLKQSRQELWLVGLDRTDAEVELLIQRSAAQAEAVRQRLIEQGIAADRLKVHGIGPLAPAMLEKGAQAVLIVIP